MIIGETTDKCNICRLHVRESREKLKLSQDRVAANLQIEGLGVNQNSVSRIDTGKRIVTDFKLAALSKVLNADVNCRFRMNYIFLLFFSQNHMYSFFCLSGGTDNKPLVSL